ncbi:GGDEF domain-containing protein [Nitratidesulfovibrio sp. SRB-5]|uniref:GGDEF domain-containing protein n=1 Tax=Nitratidesulfovibrio sp. SRB-5 TaxID=2872636 RepID=UPI001028276E|nr:GGDEF domain-containing protein [Nitratidesulfovibrio sp. SRB-5]MBZ2173247.1 GGDEF domain-containing protein [Nitratidesulfovibrio sp. SRB-5]RXF76425.1 diguanylate cyclase [Desulfovibrio sp. DS-1]
MNLPSTSLRVRLVLAFALLILALSLVLSLLAGFRSGQQVRAQIGDVLAETAWQMADKLDRSMWARRGEINILAELDALRRPADPQAIGRLLDRLQTSLPVFSWVGFTDATGRVLASTGRILEGADISARPVFSMGSRRPFVGDVHDAVLLAKLLPNPTGEPMKFVDISVPVATPDGRLAGVLAAHLSWEWARQIERTIFQSLRVDQGIDLFVVAADNTVLLGSSPAPGTPLSLDAVARARAGAMGWSVERWPDGKDYLTGYATGNGFEDYPGLGWTVLARQPLATAHAPARALERDVLAAGLLMGLLFAVIGWFVAGPVAHPLHRLTQAADRLRNGEDTEIPELRGVREIEVLSASLRGMVDALTRKQHALDRMEAMALHDKLTGLPNRRALEQHLAHAMGQPRRSGRTLALLFMDLDGFKAVNDTLGHQMGDALLRQVAERLRCCLRDDDVVARLGGDEFVMVLPGPKDQPRDGAMLVAGRVIASLNAPFDVEGNEVRVGCSVGGAVWPDDEDDVSATLHLADAALYTAKRTGKNRCVFHGPDSA